MVGENFSVRSGDVRSSVRGTVWDRILVTNEDGMMCRVIGEDGVGSRFCIKGGFIFILKKIIFIVIRENGKWVVGGHG